MKKIIFKLYSLINSITKIDELYDKQLVDYKNPKMILGKILFNQLISNNNHKKIQDYEFQIFSQWGDDGIIQFLVNKIGLINKTFIEFGVETYTESNTRYLLLNDNWSGLVIDGDSKNIEVVKNDPISWTHDLHGVSSFITKDNINSIIKENFLSKGYNKEVGILSIDIDGNDYWIWDEINVVEPTIVIVEFNGIFGIENSITIPYDATFVMNRNKFPFFWGASLKAFNYLAIKKGYTFVGCNSNANNAYFIRNDKANLFHPTTIQDEYSLPKFRLTFDDNKNPYSYSYLVNNLKDKRVINVETMQDCKFGDLFNL